MFATMIANVGVIFIPIYIYFRSNYAIADDKRLSFRKWLTFVCIESLFAIVLIHLSGEFMGIVFDSRVIFFSISMTYFGWRITLPSMLIAEGYHIFLTNHSTLIEGLIYTLILGWSMYLIKLIVSKRFESYGQLLTLVLYNVILKIFFVYMDINDIKATLLFSLVITVLSMVIMNSMYFQMNDLRILRERSDYDYLTRLLNVRKFKERLAALERNRQPNIGIAVLDLDLFKQFNDTYGHAAGDKILWGVAQLFSAYSSKNAMIYRVGGEEFAVVMVGMTRKEAELFIVDIMDNIVNRPIPLNRDELVSVTMSVGLVFAQEGETLNRLWKRADRAMYLSKENGRNQLTVSPIENK